MQFVSPMQHENGPMQLNVVNDMVKLTLLSKVTCPLSHKTMFGLVNIHVCLGFDEEYKNLTVEDRKHMIFTNETKINHFGFDGRIWC